MTNTTHPTSEQLIQAAIALIFTRGYGAVGVQELCEFAGVKKGSFYHFFPSKRDLVLAALERLWQTFATEIAACVNAPLAPYDRLNYLFTALHARHSATLAQGQPSVGCPFGSLSMEVSAQDEVLREALNRVFDAWAALFEVLYRDAVGQGLLPPDTSPQQGATALLVYLEGVLMMVKTTQNPDLLLQLRPTPEQFAAFGQSAAATPS